MARLTLVVGALVLCYVPGTPPGSTHQSSLSSRGENTTTYSNPAIDTIAPLLKDRRNNETAGDQQRETDTRLNGSDRSSGSIGPSRRSTYYGNYRDTEVATTKMTVNVTYRPGSRYQNKPSDAQSTKDGDAELYQSKRIYSGYNTDTVDAITLNTPYLANHQTSSNQRRPDEAQINKDNGAGYYQSRDTYNGYNRNTLLTTPKIVYQDPYNDQRESNNRPNDRYSDGYHQSGTYNGYDINTGTKPPNIAYQTNSYTSRNQRKPGNAQNNWYSAKGYRSPYQANHQTAGDQLKPDGAQNNRGNGDGYHNNYGTYNYNRNTASTTPTIGYQANRDNQNSNWSGRREKNRNWHNRQHDERENRNTEDAPTPENAYQESLATQKPWSGRRYRNRYSDNDQHNENQNHYNSETSCPCKDNIDSSNRRWDHNGRHGYWNRNRQWGHNRWGNKNNGNWNRHGNRPGNSNNTKRYSYNRHHYNTRRQ